MKLGSQTSVSHRTFSQHDQGSGLQIRKLKASLLPAAGPNRETPPRSVSRGERVRPTDATLQLLQDAAGSGVTGSRRGCTAKGTDPLSPRGTPALPGCLSPPSLCLLPRPEAGPLVRFGDWSYTKFRQDASLDSSACRDTCSQLSGSGSELPSPQSLYTDSTPPPTVALEGCCGLEFQRRGPDGTQRTPNFQSHWPKALRSFLENR